MGCIKLCGGIHTGQRQHQHIPIGFCVNLPASVTVSVSVFRTHDVIVTSGVILCRTQAMPMDLYNAILEVHQFIFQQTLLFSKNSFIRNYTC